jgi:hypothetical protein
MTLLSAEIISHDKKNGVSFSHLKVSFSHLKLQFLLCRKLNFPLFLCFLVYSFDHVFVLCVVLFDCVVSSDLQFTIQFCTAIRCLFLQDSTNFARQKGSFLAGTNFSLHIFLLLKPFNWLRYFVAGHFVAYRRNL